VSSAAHLTLRPDRCAAGCTACVSACPKDAVRVGDGYILVDWHACDQCCACVEACPTQAIQREIVPLRSTAATASTTVAATDVSKVRVGSRAEAKAVRKAAEQAAKQAAKSTGKPAAATRLPSAAAKGKTRPEPAESGAPAKPGSWGWVDAAAVLAVLALTIVGKNAVFAIPALSLMPEGARGVARAFVLATYYGVQLSALVFLAGRHSTSFVSAFRLGREKTSGASEALLSAALVACLLAGVEIVALAYGLVVQAAGWRQPVSLSSDVASVFGGGGLGLVLSVALVAVIAPLAEELAFRGVILSAVEGLGMWPAIAISAVVFALYHLNAWLFVPMTALGVALGWLARTRKTLWPAIALHVLYNGLAVTAAFLVPMLPK
jgi:membrane protease YdiL (CAAX protease family)/Fe-S-cluster-containing hydrogenase component 2